MQEIELPDGTILEFPEGMSDREIAAAVSSYLSESAPPETNLVEQGMSGVNEGIASALGMPVDLMASGLNLASQGIDAATGVDLGRIENPVGGSGTFRDILDFSISDTEPQTTGQRMIRRVGQEAGATAIPGLAIAGRAARGTSLLDDMTRAAQSNLPRYAAAESAGAVGSGAGAAVANEVAPDSPMAEIAGQLIGGGGVVAALSPSRPRAPSMDELRARQSAAYDTIDTSPARLAQPARDRLVSDIQGAATKSDMDEVLNPKAARVSEIVGDLEPTPSIAEVDRARRVVGRNVAGSADRGERAIGVAMRDAIDSNMANLTPGDVTGVSDPNEILRSLTVGRDMTSRIRKSETIEEALTKAQDRAATSGTGGNLVNAQRQNIRAILDSPTKRRGFKEHEIEAMREFVRGGSVENFLRLVGRMSPTAGALPTMANMGSAAAFGVPGAIPAVLGMTAKGGAEAMAARNIDQLAELIRNGAPLDPRKITPEQQAIILALSAANAGPAAQQAQ